MPDIRLVALDLDGTLLNSDKELSPANAAALSWAAAGGVEIVPTTGRFFSGMPECIRSLPFLRYAITVNGAQVYDIRHDRAIARAELPLAQALKVMDYLDSFPVIYDCYQDNWGYMTAAMQERVEEFTPNPHYQDMVRRLRTPVPELKAYLQEKGRGVQKIQLFTNDMELREMLLRKLPKHFPDTAVSSSVPENIEINDRLAHKGNGIRQLADYLGIAMEQTAAFGDGSNDLTMIRESGIGIAMANACQPALAAADWIAPSCDEDGVAAGFAYLGL